MKHIKPIVLRAGLAACLSVSSMLVVSSGTAGAETKISCQDRLRQIQSDFRRGLHFWKTGNQSIQAELYDVASSNFEVAMFLYHRANNALESYNEDCG